MSVSHEQLIHTNAPEPAQIKRLASIGAGSAAARQRLKTLQRTPRAHFFVEEVDLLADGIEDNNSFPQEIRHRMAGRVGLRFLDDGYTKVWSLKFLDTYWVNSETNGWRAERAMYRFEWNRSRTLLAERSLALVGANVQHPRERELSEEIERFYLPDDAAAFWHVQQEFERVTAEDCDGLIRDASDYFSAIIVPVALKER